MTQVTEGLALRALHQLLGATMSQAVYISVQPTKPPPEVGTITFSLGDPAGRADHPEEQDSNQQEVPGAPASELLSETMLTEATLPW